MSELQIEITDEMREEIEQRIAAGELSDTPTVVR